MKKRDVVSEARDRWPVYEPTQAEARKWMTCLLEQLAESIADGAANGESVYAREIGSFLAVDDPGWPGPQVRFVPSDRLLRLCRERSNVNRRPR